MKDSTLIASPILEILSQIEIKLNWFPLRPFSVCMYGTCLKFEKPFVRHHIISRYCLIDSAKSVEVPIELSEDCYCNLGVLIPNEQTLGTRYVLSYYKLFSYLGR